MFVFLFTDIEGSTRLWEEHTAVMTGIIARHDEILRAQIEGHGGRITKHTGDGITAAFPGMLPGGDLDVGPSGRRQDTARPEVGQPLACALEAQKRFAAEPWDTIGDLRIRVGIHAGEAEYHASAGTLEGDYFGPPVNATARVMSAAWGEQILLTPEVLRASALPEQATLLDLGEHLLKNVSAPQKLYQLVHPQLSRQDFPPPRTLSGQAIHQTVDQQGEKIAAMEPLAMAVGFLTATLLPALQGELDPKSGALEGNLGVLDDLGAATLRDFTAQFAGRLQARQQAGEALPAPELQSLLHGELLTRWQAGGEAAVALRSDTSRLLQAVHGVQAAMTAATDEVREALAQSLADLGSQFGEFHWMLAGVQDTLAKVRARQALQLALQREQLDLQRQQLVKTNLLLHRQRGGPPVAELTVAGEVEEPPPADLPCPYMGLAAFEAEDTEYFFGREELVAELTARLAGTRFLAVVGPSGSGKSSLVRAGLLPDVWAGALPDSGDWQTLVLTPGAHPLEELAVRVSLLRGIEPSSLHDALQKRPQALHLAIKQALAEQPATVKLLLVVDQFEEIFALCHDEAERQRFVDALVYAVEAEEGQTIVVPTIRADFYGRCADYPKLAARMSDGLLVGPMSEEELRATIEQPAAVVGLRLEPGLAEMILDDVAGEPGALPLLSHALLETFVRRRGAELTLSGYAASGGVAGAIAQTADTVYDGLDPEEQALARGIFLRLTELGEEGTQDTRRRVAPGELVHREDEAPAVEALLRTLAGARLVTTGENTVEVAHEALIREWPALRGWLEEDREGLRIHRHLTEAAGEWQRLGREPGELYRGARLAAAGEWTVEHGHALNPLERDFLAASRALSQQEEAEREAQRQRELEAARALAAEQEKRAEEQAKAAGRLRQRALLLAGAMVVAVILAAVAFLAFRQADQSAQSAQVASTQAVSERNAAETAQALEADQRAMAEAEGWARATAQAGAEAETEARATQQAVAEAEAKARATQQAVAEAETKARATAQAEAEAAEEDARREAGIGLASQAGLQMIGPNPERAVLLALEAVENYPYTWQTEHALGQAVLNHKLHLDLHHGAWVNKAYLSPDGTRIVTSGDDGRAVVWAYPSGEELFALAGLGSMGQASWSPSGDRILGTGRAGVPKVWDANTGQELVELPGHNAWFADWSPDGTRILTYYSRQQDTAVVWDAASGEVSLTLPSDQGFIRSADWSPDGNRIVSSIGRVWDAATGEELLTLSEGRLQVYSPDGSLIVGAGPADGTAKVWNATTGDEVFATSAGHAAGLRVSAFWSPSGDRFLTVGADDTAKVWDTETGEELYTLPGVNVGTGVYGAWSPDGTLILTAGDSGEMKVWDSATGKELLAFPAHSAEVATFEWLPSGDRIITTSADGSAKVWDVSGALFPLGCRPSCPVSPVGGWYSAAAWSPDGKQAARGFVDSSIRVWDVASGDQVLSIQYEPEVEGFLTGGVGTVAWSPEGYRLLTAANDGVARVWDTSSGEALLTLPGHGAELMLSAAWSPDGNRILTFSEDGSAKVWDANAGQVLLTFSEHNPFSASWSPDGSLIVTTDELSDIGSAKIWDAATGEVLLDLFPKDFSFGVSAAVWSPDGTRIVTFSEDKLGRIWDANSGEELLAFAGVSGGDGAMWSPAGDRFLIGGMGGAIRVFNAHSGEELVNYATGMPAAASWSPDGQHIAISDWEGDLEINPAWQTLEELITQASECCIFRELTPDEREQFGLPQH